MRNGYTDLPAGKLANVVTYLEMRTPPPALGTPTLSEYIIRCVKRPDLDWYRAVYREIGEPWLWFSRLRLSDDELRQFFTILLLTSLRFPTLVPTKDCLSSTVADFLILSCRSLAWRLRLSAKAPDAPFSRTASHWHGSTIRSASGCTPALSTILQRWRST